MADERRRATLKASLSRLRKNVDAVDEDTIDIGTVTAYKERLKKIESDILGVHNELVLNSLDQAEADAHQVLHELTEQRLDELTARLANLDVIVSSRNPNPRQGQKPEVHLPKMELPCFSGDVQKWQSFHDLFTSMVHNNAVLAPAQKLQYLKLSLKGDAARLIDTVQVTDANYRGAWDSLIDRYANERVIVFAQIQRLMEQPVLQQETASQLRRLIDTTSETLRSLENLKRDVKHWDDLLVYVLLQKLDPETRRRWELQLQNSDVPTFEELMKFLTQQAIALDSLSTAKVKSKPAADPAKAKPDGKTSSQSAKSHQVTTTAPSAFKCPICEGKHFVYKCEELKKMAVPDRVKAAKNASLCFNCLRKGHAALNCTSTNCRTCNEKHNTLLHPELEETVNSHHGNVTKTPARCPAHVLLATAIVRVTDSKGSPQDVRALVDIGSQSSFMTSSCVNRLGLKRQPASLAIMGISSVRTGTASFTTTFRISSRYNSSKPIAVEAIVMDQLTGLLPGVPVKYRAWPHLKNLPLADPDFDKPNKIDVLLGADVLGEFLLANIARGGPNTPTAQNTTLGWIVFGPTANASHEEVTITHTQCSLDSSLERFWKVEEVPSERSKTAEERQCEDHFDETCSRNVDGSYTVQLPFKANPKTELGDSKALALRRFKQLERRLDGNAQLKQQYVAFIQEFLDLGHIEEVPSDQLEKPPGEAFYLPHHGVLKESSTTTKLRVVFDGSAKTNSGVALNELLMVGPVLQEDLFSILVRFRSYRVPIVADLKQMFRHIWLHPCHRDYFRILWRFEKTEPIKVYRSKTVLYGSACATYQATKTLQRLALDEAKSHPIAAQKILNDFYVDDLMSGSANLKEALKLQEDLLKVMPKGNFVLRKWSSSYEELLSRLDPDMRETQIPLSIEEDDSIKTLGLRWTPGTDCFSFEVIEFVSSVPTKRNVLSDLAKVFDPLGLLAATTVTGKIFMQTLWKNKTDWDTELSAAESTEWLTYRKELQIIQKLKIPRFLGCVEGSQYELLGFADASEKAYGALVYVRTITANGSVKCNLVAAKTKIAPLQQISLPRLELCAAVLLTRLMKVIGDALPIQFSRRLCWTDSTVVRDWIHSQPQRWRTYIANRVTIIQDEFRPEQWHHVSGAINPADAASRGISATELIGNDLWWHGPPFLRKLDYSSELQPNPAVKVEAGHEERKVVVHHVTFRKFDTVKAYSSLRTLKRHVAIWLRYIKFLQKSHTEKMMEPISVQELDLALTRLIRVAQREDYGKEIKALENKVALGVKSSILALAPFLDDAGLLRVGGRLRNSALPYERKFPLLLPPHHHLTKLIIRYVHEQQFHGGNQLTLYTLQQRYWVPRGKSAVRACIKSCMQCFRFSHHQSEQLMGDLPSARLTPSVPFHRTGLDYGGPFTVRLMKGRSNKTFKAYVALFVCFSTRAVHLELVSDLSSESFLAALKRFVSRRSCPLEIRSDNGTNFVGADRELKEFVRLVNSEDTRRLANPYLQEKGIRWIFNPPSAPHMSGFWEAGIKSAKFHLKRVMGTASFTYEELETVMVQVEACLNSRPLCPNNADPNELAALTPGHFLVGGPLNAVPEPSYTELKENRLSRWQLMQQRVQHFWRRWSSEYLVRLQQRPKWLQKQRNLAVGDVVLLKDDQLPPQKWKLGRIQDVHPGADNIIRVVTVKTAEGSYKRPITKVSLLPFEELLTSETGTSSTKTETPGTADPTVRNDISRSAGNVRAHVARGKRSYNPVRFAHSMSNACYHAGEQTSKTFLARSQGASASSPQAKRPLDDQERSEGSSSPNEQKRS